jgi:hypothetical protein
MSFAVNSVGFDCLLIGWGAAHWQVVDPPLDHGLTLNLSTVGVSGIRSVIVL